MLYKYAIKKGTHKKVLSHLTEFDKRWNEKDVNQAAKEKLPRTAYMVLKHPILHEHYERLVHLAMNGVKLGKLVETFLMPEETWGMRLQPKI